MEMLYFLLMLVSMLALVTMKFFGITGAFVGLKALASVLFIITGIVGYKKIKKNRMYFIWILLGLVFSFGGDVFLELYTTRGILFINGVASFALAHIMYFIGFCSLRKLNIIDIIIGIAIATPLILLQLSGGFEYGGMKLIVIVYTILISLMVSKAISLHSYYRNGKKAVTLTIAGALMFLVSDIILLFLFFSKGVFYELNYVNLIIYYVGQGLLALSLGQKLINNKA